MEKKFLIASIQSLNIWDFVISISYDFVVLSSNVMTLDTVYTSMKVHSHRLNNQTCSCSLHKKISFGSNIKIRQENKLKYIESNNRIKSKELKLNNLEQITEVKKTDKNLKNDSIFSLHPFFFFCSKWTSIKINNRAQWNCYKDLLHAKNYYRPFNH
jgi:hypothetical protein